MALAASIENLSVIDHVGNLFTFCGGLGMFLYGMHVMSDGIQRSAGDRMRQLLGILTNNRVLAILVGALITAIIQSSGATTVMVVGFVNAGLMGLGQAVGVIMGANIGTCITSWIVSMESLGDAFKAMSPSLYAPFLIGIGAFFTMFAKKQGKKLAGFYEKRSGYLYRIAYFYKCITPVWGKSTFRYCHWCIGDGTDAKFICIGGHSSNACIYRRCSYNSICSLY